MYAYPIYPQRNTCFLDGFWEFALLEKNLNLNSEIKPSEIVYNDTMPVPGCFDATFKYVGIRGLAAYKRTVQVAAPGRYRLILHAIGLAGKVFCNDKEIFYCQCPWSQQSVEFTVEATSFELTILVDNRIKPGESATVLFLPNYDFYGYGGIYRSVELEKLPETGQLGRVKVETLDLNGKVKISGQCSQELNELQIAFDEGEFIRVTSGFHGKEFEFEAVVPDPELWTPENPRLHTVKVKSSNDEIIERFGLRTIKAQDGKILLNGQEIRLIGYNRHDMHPQLGPAVSDNVWIEDLQLLKDLNCNFIRGAHYPQSQRFLDLCDQMGFLVWEESLGWGNRKTSTENQKFVDLQLAQTANMVQVGCNHPSVIIWGFTNECNDNEESGDIMIRKLAAEIRKYDQSRLVTMATMFIKTSLSLDVFDVISFNSYPGWYEIDNPDNPHPLSRIKEVLDEILAKLESDGHNAKPIIISEIGAAALYGCHDRMRSFWSEEYQADLLTEVCRYFKDNQRFSGLALWHFADAKTYSATAGVMGRPRGFNNKGTLDEYRRPKLAYDRVKEEFGKIKHKN